MMTPDDEKFSDEMIEAKFLRYADDVFDAVAGEGHPGRTLAARQTGACRAHSRQPAGVKT